MAAKVTLLPARFGVVLPSEPALVERVLFAQRQHLEEYLDHVEAAVEITLRAAYVEEEVLRNVMEARPDLARSAQRSRGHRAALTASESRIEMGRQIAIAIDELKARDAQELVATIAPAARDVRVSKPLAELMLLNASFLVERAKLATFDRILQKVNAQLRHRMTFDCVGPLPPFSFVDLRL